MATMHVQATGSGRIVGWQELKEGRLVDTSRLARLFLSTVLTDVITDLCTLAESLDPDYRIITVIPNGFTTAALDLSLVGSEFEISCARRLVRGLFPLNPIAAEFGSNYDVVVNVNTPSEDIQSRVVQLLNSKYSCRAIG